MPKEIYEWFIQHPGVKVETYYEEIFEKLYIRMSLEHFHIKCMIEDFDLIKDINRLLVNLDCMHEELIKHKEIENGNTTSIR